MPASILLLHPGAMGSAIGAILVGNGHDVRWVATGRSKQSRERASAAGLVACESMKEGLTNSELVLSVCPPHAAVDLAREVVAAGLQSHHYIDANAVSPQASQQVAELIRAAGGLYTDGGIIGPPPGGRRTARLYLSGAAAASIAPVFAAPALRSLVLDGSEFAASALKMCFAGWNKARAALLMNLRALADTHGVDEALLAEWSTTDPGLASYFNPESGGSVMQNSLKAWRWSGEMTEIASTFEAAGLPGHIHHGAAEIFARLESFKDADSAPEISQLIAALRQ